MLLFCHSEIVECEQFSTDTNLSTPSLHELHEKMKSLEIDETVSAEIEIPIETNNIRRGRRNSGYRSNDENKLNGIKNRTIQRPKKNHNATVDFDNLDLRKLKLIYCKKEIKTIKCTQLETIVEDPIGESGDERLQSTTVIVGKPKLRKLKQKDPLNVPKVLKERRKKRAKELRGGRKGFKKISKECFKQILESMANSADFSNLDTQGKKNKQSLSLQD